MDLVDAQILRLLSWSPVHPVDVERGPMTVWDIARRLGVHGNTVKRRLQDLQDAGILLGLSFFPNSTDFGLRVSYYAFRFADEGACDVAYPKVLAAKTPGLSVRLASPEIRCHIVVPVDEDPAEAATAWAQSLGAIGVERLADRYWEAPAVTDLEMRVLKELHKDLFATPPDIAQRVGVTPKTVRRCIQSLRDKKAFCVVPLIQYTRTTGLHVAHLDVRVADEEVARVVYRSAGELIPNGFPARGFVLLAMFAPTAADIAATAKELRSITGVEEVRVHTVLEEQWQTLPTGLRSLADELTRRPLLTAR